MDYQEFLGAIISEQDKAFAQEFANFVNGQMCPADQTGKEPEHTATSSSRCSKCSSVLCASWHTTISRVLVMNAMRGLHNLHRKRTLI